MKRIYIIGTMKVTSPLHVGSGETFTGEGRPDTNNPVQLDDNGSPYLPATAIGGLLRGTAENLVTVLDGWKIKDVWELFGEARQSKGNQSAHPSRLRLHHATLKGEWQDHTRLRDGVGIDRRTATAKARMLYNYEIVPAGSEFSLKIELHDNGDESNKNKQLLTLILEAITQLPKAIGAMGRIGLGAFQLHLDKVVEIDLTKPEDLLKFLSQKSPFNAEEEEGTSWERWKKAYISKAVSLKEEKNRPVVARIPQAVTFTYRLRVNDPLLIRGQEAPESALMDYESRSEGNFVPDKDARGIDALWIGMGEDPSERIKWRPILPGASLRGVFRSHCERILRTLSLSCYPQEDEYKKHVAASDPLTRDEQDHLRSSGFMFQSKIGEEWRKKMSGGGDEPQKRYEAGMEVAKFIWECSDPGERMWGSSQWASYVSVSEAHLSPDQEDMWQEILLQNVAINRFTGGAAEQKLFNALVVARATFEGRITVFGDELWMLGLIALLFKDIHEGMVRIGSGKTRGRGLVEGWLTGMEVKAINGSRIAGKLSNHQGTVWKTRHWQANEPSAFLEGMDKDLIGLLEAGVQELQDVVKGYTRFECRGEEASG